MPVTPDESRAAMTARFPDNNAGAIDADDSRALVDAVYDLFEAQATALSDLNIPAGENDIAWPGGTRAEVFQYWMAQAASGCAVRRLGAPTTGPGTVIRIYSAVSYPLTLRQDAAAGTGAKFWFKGGDRVLMGNDAVTLVYDNTGYWIAVDSGGAGITWEGAYSAATAYQAGDVVSYGGRYYLALQNSTGSTPA